MPRCYRVETGARGSARPAVAPVAATLLAPRPPLAVRRRGRGRRRRGDRRLHHGGCRDCEPAADRLEIGGGGAAVLPPGDLALTLLEAREEPRRDEDRRVGARADADQQSEGE